MNGIGFGNVSDSITILSDRTPLKMAPPTNDPINGKSIVLNWVGLSEF